MGRFEYLYEIEKILKDQMLQNEICDMIHEYDVFFEEQKAQGKSEQEIMNSLGTPVEVAQKIILREKKTVLEVKVKENDILVYEKSKKINSAWGLVLGVLVYPILFLLVSLGVLGIGAFLIGIILLCFASIFLSTATLIILVIFALSLMFFSISLILFAISMLLDYNKIYFTNNFKDNKNQKQGEVKQNA